MVRSCGSLLFLLTTIRHFWIGNCSVLSRERNAFERNLKFYHPHDDYAGGWSLSMSMSISHSPTPAPGKGKYSSHGKGEKKDKKGKKDDKKGGKEKKGGKGKGKDGKDKVKNKGKGKGKGEVSGSGMSKGKGKGKGNGGMTPVGWYPSPDVASTNPATAQSQEPAASPYTFVPTPTSAAQPEAPTGSRPVLEPVPSPQAAGGTEKPAIVSPTQVPISQPTTAGTVNTPGGSLGSATASPTVSQASVVLNPYSLGFDVVQSRDAVQDDFNGLQSTVDQFLDFFFQSVFDMESDLIYNKSITEQQGTSFNPGQSPINVDYLTTVAFDPKSGFVPSDSDIYQILEFLFTDPDSLASFISTIQGLPPTNLFSTTSNVTFQGSSLPGVQSSKSPTKTAGIAAGAGAGFILMLVAIVVYRNRRSSGGDPLGKFYDGDVDGHLTVAGETFVGCSSVDAQSIAQHRLRSGDGESVWSGYQEATAGERRRAPSPSATLEDVPESEDDSVRGSDLHQLEDVHL